MFDVYGGHVLSPQAIKYHYLESTEYSFMVFSPEHDDFRSIFLSVLLISWLRVSILIVCTEQMNIDIFEVFTEYIFNNWARSVFKS